MKIYISGPIAGIPDFKDHFFTAELELQRLHGSVSVINPTVVPAWDHIGECPPSYTGVVNGHTAACYLRGDLLAMLRYCDALFMLSGWENSIGARLEHSVAAHCGMPIYYSYGEVPLG